MACFPTGGSLWLDSIESASGIRARGFVVHGCVSKSKRFSVRKSLDAFRKSSDTELLRQPKNPVDYR